MAGSLSSTCRCVIANEKEVSRLGNELKTSLVNQGRLCGAGDWRRQGLSEGCSGSASPWSCWCSDDRAREWRASPHSVRWPSAGNLTLPHSTAVRFSPKVTVWLQRGMLAMSAIMWNPKRSTCPPLMKYRALRSTAEWQGWTFMQIAKARGWTGAVVYFDAITAFAAMLRALVCHQCSRDHPTTDALMASGFSVVGGYAGSAGRGGYASWLQGWRTSGGSCFWYAHAAHSPACTGSRG